LPVQGKLIIARGSLEVNGQLLSAGDGATITQEKEIAIAATTDNTEILLFDRSQLYKDLASGPFFGFNRPGAKVSQGAIDWFWFQGMQAGHKNTFDCIKAFSETDFTEDLKKFDVPTLILHGDDDQIEHLKYDWQFEQK
jgi:pimeloyl-ACP methyl ester carboxylesterase